MHEKFPSMQQGENCIQNSDLGRHIVGYTEIKFYSDTREEPLDMISEYISNDKPPQMKILNMVIPILFHLQFCLESECCKPA